MLDSNHGYPEPLTVSLKQGFPAVVLWDGELALFVDDRTTSLPTFEGVGKVVTAARLRAIADLIESSAAGG